MRRKSGQNLLQSFRHAAEGLWFVISCERNARIHLSAAVFVIALSFWLGLESIEWALVGTAIGLVFAGEMLNTVVEMSIDLISPDEHVMAKCVKDVAAGAVLISALVAVFIGLLVLGPPLLDKFGWL